VFVDRVRVSLRAGDGGAGVVAFAKTKGKPKGKPVGGNGGVGGSVILRADPAVGTLLRYKRNPHHSAGHGTHGQGDLRHGRSGADVVLPVPLGTSVYDEDGTLIADLVAEGQAIVAVRGGKGGRGNAAFVTPSNRVPSVAEQGEYGREEWFALEMKLLADAALIGFPNAGKSTFISKVSAANPKIAAYPFTTLQPHLGVVSFDEREMVLADIPGLIEGAAEGKGLGYEFLRHIERARVLVILLDPSAAQEVTAEEQLGILDREIHQYSPEIAARPRVILVTKSDLGDSGDVADRLGALPVSAMTGEGVRRALHAIADQVGEAERLAPERRGFVLHRPLGPGFTISREEGAWRIEGLPAERAVAFADLTLDEAADMASRRLTRLGVDDALADAGAVDGDEVRIGEISFVYTPEASDEEE